MLAALLALLASFTWGTSNYLAGVESRTRSVWQVAALSQIMAAAASAVGLLAARQGPPGGWDLAILLVTGAATAAGLVMFYQALAIGTMSVVAPIIASEVLIPVTAGIVMGERPGAARLRRDGPDGGGRGPHLPHAPPREAAPHRATIIASPARPSSSPSSRPSPGASCCWSTARPASRAPCGPCSTRA